MGDKGFMNGVIRRVVLLLTTALYLLAPYPYKETPANCTCGCREFANTTNNRTNCCLKCLDHDGNTLHRCYCCSNPDRGRKISARCRCHTGKEAYAGSSEIIVPRVERVGLFNEIGKVMDFDDGIFLPGYKIPPMKPPPRSSHGVLEL